MITIRRKRQRTLGVCLGVKMCRPTQLISVVAATALTALVFLSVAPHFFRARSGSITNPCLYHLRCIDGAKRLWAADHRKTINDTPAWGDILPYISTNGGIPKCPQAGSYILGRGGEAPRCTYPGH